MKKILLNIVTTATLGISLVGCGGGGGGTTPTDITTTEKTAYLVDSAVEGIDYICGTLTGVTDSTGKFTYDSTKCPTGVEFKLRNLSLGTINPNLISNTSTDKYLTIQELAGTTRGNITHENVVKLAILLQSLDSDNNASNGIDINSTIRTSFSLTGNISDINDTALQTEIIARGKTKVHSVDAINHLLTFSKQIDPTITTTAPKKVLRTGQTTSYVVGDDAWYVTNQNLGLARSFTRNETTQIVTDNVTGLQWQDDITAATTAATWDNANNICQVLNNATFGGYTDWRLPTIEELYTTINQGTSQPYKFMEFSNVASNIYWSSTTSAGYSDVALYVALFNSSHGGGGYKSNSYNVRCVRAGQ